MRTPTPKALLFDVFGTTLDWWSTVKRELSAWGGEGHDWGVVANRWRSGFRSLQFSIAKGETDWMTMDNIHLTVLREILVELDKTDTPESQAQELNSVWHRLDPWPDSVEGLTLLRQDRVVGALSNGNLMMLIDNAKHSGLPWDVVLSTDMIGTSKPNPAVYEGAARLLGIPPDEIMMVAAHAYDVDGAKATGMRTAYVHRPDEHGPGHGDDHGDLSRFDIVADSFIDLHQKLNS